VDIMAMIFLGIGSVLNLILKALVAALRAFVTPLSSTFSSYRMASLVRLSSSEGVQGAFFSLHRTKLNMRLSQSLSPGELFPAIALLVMPFEQQSSGPQASRCFFRRKACNRSWPF